MIRLYTWRTPNGRKASIMLEECGLDYEVVPVDLSTGAQKAAEFLAVNPNGKIPALVDDRGGEPLVVFESGAVLVHLAETEGRFFGRDRRERLEALSWTFWQVGGIGPMAGQFNHFRTAGPEAAAERFRAETLRLLDVLETRLTDRDHLAGEYSIADIAAFTWVKAIHDLAGEALGFAERPRTRAWLERVGARPAVAKGLAVPA